MVPEKSCSLSASTIAISIPRKRSKPSGLGPIIRIKALTRRENPTAEAIWPSGILIKFQLAQRRSPYMTEALLGSPYMDLIFSIMRARRRKKKEVGKRLIRTHPYFPLPASRAHENLVFGKASAIWGNPLTEAHSSFHLPRRAKGLIVMLAFASSNHAVLALSFELGVMVPPSVVAYIRNSSLSLKSCLLRTPPFFEYPDETIRDRNEYTLFRGKESLTYLNRRSKIEMDPTLLLQLSRLN